MQGTVVWFNDVRGFGFIKGQDREYFCHYSCIKGNGYKTLHEGEEVTFEPQESERGPLATEVVVVRTVDGEEIPAAEKLKGKKSKPY